LCRTVEREIDRPAAEVLSTDVVPSADALRFLERNAASILRAKKVPIRARPTWLWGQRDVIYRRPHGIVGIIGTWNYPIFLNVVPIAQALTAGNAVLWKPSELMPATAELVHRLFLEAGYPGELLRLLPATREAGPELIEADIDHVVFTGSAVVGRRLAARLGERLISSTLELSGVDALFVCRDTDLDLAARAVWFGFTLNKGQTCLAVRRVFVDQSIYPAFLEALRSTVALSTPMKVALAAQAAQAEELVEDAVAKGATVWRESADSEGVGLVRPIVVVDANPEMRICQEAAFSPIVAILPFSSLDDAITKHETCEYGLGASIFTTDRSTIEFLASRLRVGVVTVNDVIVPTAHPATPFGGRKASGWGVTQGGEGLLAMTVPQVVSVRQGRWRPHFSPLNESSPITALLRGWLQWNHGDTHTRWRGLGQIVTAAFRLVYSGKSVKGDRETT
jgi:acyl-CoA reductase-like NAD-dependent aldehyde dehydrogenase